MNFNRRKQEEQNILCALHTLTNFCLRECVKAGEGQQQLKQADPCFTSCARNYIDMRFRIKEKWMEDYSATEHHNSQLWQDYAGQ